ncbi:hypothetical protein FB45DRAFT_452504 [Roridomyces roridus]|uniref:Nephrocystin 3-like N-terminal domain-containing protein n=1 Tax=Roridomyces roridus TaxID=1738132 RepID=A0AAD7FTE8_9AGAR|nr:hypothetical protein FB45DRAFT_452504 [Roridomyces roridus]
MLNPTKTFSRSSSNECARSWKSGSRWQRLVQLPMNFTLPTWMSVVHSIENTRQLENLPGAKISEVRYDQGNRCLPDTRQEVIDEIVDWVNKPESTPYFWLYGVAGSGKSTISNTIAEMFDKLHRLGGSFRFSRDIASRNEPTYIFGNLAFQITQLSPQLKSSVLDAIRQNGPMGSFPLRNQFATYIVDVLNSVDLTGPIVFVIDALDESGTEQVRSVLLAALASEVARLPKSVRFLIISRDEADIRAQLKRVSTSKAMHQLEETSRDILVFINNRMPEIRARSERLAGTHWPDMAARQKLVEKSHNLFIWAVVACRYIETLDPAARLKAVLASNQRALVSAESSLDHLYLRILQDVCADPDMPFQEVVGCIIAAMTPLTVQGLDDLLAYGHQSDEGLERDLSQLGSAESVIGLLGSILQREVGTKGQASAVVRVLHPSLLDFFTNPLRCTDTRFFLQPSTQHRSMFLRCVAVMQSLLKRDICEINDPTKLNSEVPNLQRRIEKCLPEHLQYSCRFWASHLVQVDDLDDPLVDVLRGFLFSHLLHWIEAMTLMNEFDAAFIALEKVHRRLERKDIVSICADALRFMQQFETPIRESAAHIYASALAFTPTETTISKTFSSNLSRVPRVRTGLAQEWSSCLAIYPLYSTQPYSWSVDVSKDKLRFATRSSETFHIRSMATGAILSSFTIDKPDSVYSSSEEHLDWRFSADGTYLVIYTHFTIQFWDTFTGTKWLGPIPAVFHAISQDGAYLATALDTLLVWDVHQQVVIAEPDLGPFPSLEKEPIGVNPIAPFVFSPDGQQLLRWVSDANSSTLSIAWFEIATGTVTWTNRSTNSPLDPLFCWLDNHTAVMNVGSRMEIFAPKSGETLHQYELASDSGSTLGLSLLSGGTLSLLAGGTVTPTIAVLQPREGTVVAGPYSLASYDPYPAYGDGHICLCTRSDSGEAIEVHRICHNGESKQVLVIPDRTHGPAALALFSDDARIFVLFRDGDLLVWDVENGNHSILQLPAHFRNAFQFGMDISPDESRLLISNNYDVQLFDLAMQYRVSKDIHSASSSTTDRYAVLVAASGRSTKIAVAYSDFSLELQSTMNRQRLLGHTDEITSVAFSVDGSRIVSASNDSTICLWNVGTASIEGEPIRGHSAAVTGAAFSNCGTKMASVSKDRTVRIWDAATREPLWVAKQLIDGLNAISFNHQDTKLVCRSLRSQVVLDLETRRGRRLLPIKWISLISDKVFAFSENGDWWSWDTSGSPTGYHLSIPSDSYCLRLRELKFLPDKLRVMGLYDEFSVKIADIQGGSFSCFPIPDNTVRSLKWLPGGRIVVHGVDYVFVWDTVSRDLVAEWYLPYDDHNCLSPDGSKMVFCHSVSSGISVQLVDLMTSRVIWTHNPDLGAAVARISSCIFSSNGDVELSVGFLVLTPAHLAPTAPPPQLFTLHADTGHVVSKSAVQFDEDGFITGRRREAYAPPHTIRAHSTDLDKTASLITTRTVALVNVATGTIDRTLLTTETEDRRWPMTYSSDGMLVACATGDTVSVWDSQTGNTTNSWCHSSEKTTDLENDSSGLIFSQDSTQLIYFNWYQEPGFHLWDIRDNTLTGVLSGDYFGPPRFFPDGSGISLRRRSQADQNPIQQWAISRDPHSRGLTEIDPSLQVSLPLDQFGEAFHISPTGSLMERARAFVGAPWVMDSSSPDSTTLAVLNTNSLIEIYQQHSTATDLVSEVTTAFTCPHDLLGINPSSIIGLSGWLYGYTGQRLLWVPQTERKIWALLKSGLLVLENNAKELVLVDLKDYLVYPGLRRAWGDRNFVADPAYGKAQQLAVAVNRVDIMEEFARKEAQ